MKQSIPFKTNEKGIGAFAIPLDGKLPKGLFVIRTDYKTSTGKECYDQHRIAIADFLENKHRLKNIFTKQYGGDANCHDLKRKLERFKKVGIGKETHAGLDSKDVYDVYQSYGVEVADCNIISRLYKLGTRQKAGFEILKEIKHKTYPYADDADNILVRDFKLDSNGKITPEYLEKFKHAVSEFVKARPWVRLWRPLHEFYAAFPVSWWSETNDPEEAAYKFAQLQKAFVEGVREVNPKALVSQDSPCNMAPASGIAETDRLNAACNKLGVKFDIIGFHPYRYPNRKYFTNNNWLSYLPVYSAEILRLTLILRIDI